LQPLPLPQILSIHPEHHKDDAAQEKTLTLTKMTVTSDSKDKALVMDHDKCTLPFGVTNLLYNWMSFLTYTSSKAKNEDLKK
jgi:hypothetical protein